MCSYLLLCDTKISRRKKKVNTQVLTDVPDVKICCAAHNNKLFQNITTYGTIKLKTSIITAIPEVSRMETRRLIIEKCKKIKEELGYSYEYIAEQTGIPKSTVVRFFSSPDGTSCLFDTVQQIESFLFGFNEPAPKNDKQLINEVPLSLVEMKESYELIIKARIDDFRKEHQEHMDDNTKNAELIKELKAELTSLRSEYKLDLDVIRGRRDTDKDVFLSDLVELRAARERDAEKHEKQIEELKKEHHQIMAENKKDHAAQIAELKNTKKWLVIAVVGLTVLIFIALILDIFVLTNKGWFIK